LPAVPDRRCRGGAQHPRRRVRRTPIVQRPVTPYRTAVVTGASGGIGRAVVDELIRLGLHVHALGLPDASLEAMRGLGAVTIHPVDVRDTSELGRTLAAVLEIGEVDV